MIVLQALLIYAIVGAVVGVLAGMLGIGGGLVVVPALVLIFTAAAMDEAIITQLAVGTSLATIIITALISTWSHHKKTAVLWPLFKRLAPGITIGAIIGAFIATRISSNNLKQVFGIFEILIALQMVLPSQFNKRQPKVPDQAMTFVGMVIGAISALLGIGGGTLTVPYLSWQQIGIRQAVATAAACGIPIAISGALSYIIMGYYDPRLPAYALGFVYWPSTLCIGLVAILTVPTGVMLAHRLPTHLLRKIFAVCLLLLGVSMIIM